MRVLVKNITLWSLTLGHFSVDMLSGAVPIVVGLYLKETLRLDLAQIGLLLAAYKMTSSLTQPLFGYLSDRYGGRWFAVGGLLWMSVLMGVVGLMPTFGSVMFVTTLAGLGSAAFHPQGAAGANHAAGEYKTAGVAMFMLGGNGGYALGPILAALICGWAGVRGTVWLGAIGLAIAPFLYYLTGRGQVAQGHDRRTANWRIEFNPLFSTVAIIALILIMSLRAWSQESFSSFLPQFFVEIAYFSKTQASLLATVMLLALALGSLTGGILADRVGGATVMVVSMLFSAPLMAAVVMLGDWRSFLVAPLLGFASGAAWPPMLVMAQSLFPKNAGVGTGVALGFVFAMGGLGLQFTGWLAEPAHVGLHTAVLLLSPIPLVTVLLVFLLPSGRRHVQRTPIMQTAGVVGGK